MLLDHVFAYRSDDQVV